MSDTITIPKLEEVVSSNLAKVGHSADGLFVEFKSGAVWLYKGVTAEAHQLLLKAESLGKHFAAEIKGKFEELRVA